ncbi:hypothetical protein PC116_g24515 [Phytophthora cactorum]|uniref:Uncharacterized protein n=1 Tax=Phytophthora cactorum TaxID=29920 RepID=A0A8T1BRT1_9STRA|nr:hypothetical protein PC111_g19774 [Phytophthora cactorum]KAG2802641.1 hypothetical protein PC112_g19542 [Phytophthora cactorum]KAG2834567.1 hypothetical protein PC113_g20371 [Phytophthora cactorum]KAG2880733.1 hypothetical protein PC114_g21926 [Phytophthora cactorum]KAG2888592.1 hypothetical protein PC115_g20000 [Phytophthora cactorum]
MRGLRPPTEECFKSSSGDEAPLGVLRFTTASDFENEGRRSTAPASALVWTWSPIKVMTSATRSCVGFLASTTTFGIGNCVMEKQSRTAKRAMRPRVDG